MLFGGALMSGARERLKYALQVWEALPEGTPTDAQLDCIIRDVSKKRRPTAADWSKATSRHVPRTGRARLIEGEDMSDLNLLLFQIINQSGGGSPLGQN
jgi:hypothetical protein